MKGKAKQVYELIWRTRRLFQQLRASSERMLEAHGINPSQRAVLEFLQRDDRRTVSEMARRRNVSRQHVQVTVNALLALGLVAARDNPAHKRSPLITLTARGRQLFARIEREEARLLAGLEGDFDEADLAVSINTLARLQERLRSSADIASE